MSELHARALQRARLRARLMSGLVVSTSIVAFIATRGKEAPQQTQQIQADSSGVLEGNNSALAQAAQDSGVRSAGNTQESAPRTAAEPQQSAPPRDGAQTASIRGRIVAGNKPIGGVRVFAFPSAAYHAARDIERALAGDPKFPGAVSGADGAFEIAGLDRNNTYSILAGGNGYCIPHPVMNITPRDEPQDYSVRAAYGLIVKITEANGRSLLVDPKLVAIPSPSDEVIPELLQSAPVPLPLAMLCGVPLAELKKPETQQCVVAYHSETDGESLSLVRVRRSFPGYSPLDEPIVLPRLRAPIQTRTAKLIRTARSFAEATIELLDVESARTPQPRGQPNIPIQTIEFRERDGTGFDIKFSDEPDAISLASLHSLFDVIVPATSHVATVPGIPSGVYEARVVDARRMFPSRWATVEIVEPKATIRLSVLP